MKPAGACLREDSFLVFEGSREGPALVGELSAERSMTASGFLKLALSVSTSLYSRSIIPFLLLAGDDLCRPFALSPTPMEKPGSDAGATGGTETEALRICSTFCAVSVLSSAGFQPGAPAYAGLGLGLGLTGFGGTTTWAAGTDDGIIFSVCLAGS